MKIFLLNNTQGYNLRKARENMIESRKWATKYQEALFKVEQKIFEEVFLGYEKAELPAKAGFSECEKFAFYFD